MGIAKAKDTEKNKNTFLGVFFYCLDAESRSIFI